MRFGVESLNLEFELGRCYCRAKIPLRFKLTFYIGAVSLVCMIILAAACIAQALANTQTLMQKRLSQFASINSQQIEMIVNNQAARLNNALQSDSLTRSYDSLYNGAVTTSDWASNLDSLARYLFSTSLQSFQALYLYDNSATLLYSLANPELKSAKLQQLRPALPAVLPLGFPVNSSYQLSSNYTTVTAQAAQAAVNASYSALNSTEKNFTTILNHSSIPMVNLSRKILEQSSKSTLELNFTTTTDGFLNWVSRPVALANTDGIIESYSFSLSAPVTELTVVDSVQTSRLVGYCTAISDCSKISNLNDNAAYNDSSLGREMRNPTFAVIDADPDHGWKYLFPVGSLSDVSNSTWHSFDSFPAVSADMELSSRSRNTSRAHKAGGALMNTHSPNLGKASVGFSFASVLNRKWYITLSLPKAQVEYGYHHLTNILIAVATVLLVFVVAAAFFLTGMITSPVIHIYRGLVLKPRQRNDVECKSELNGFGISTGDKRADSDLRTLNSSAFRTASDQETVTEIQGVIQSAKQDKFPKLPVASEWDENSHSNESLGTIYFDEEEEEVPFQVPQPLSPLDRRWISDEFDELIREYNNMIDKLKGQCFEMEDEVRSRTREARENQRLAETANAAKSRFMMNISHELLTPMNGIMGITAVTIEETDLEAIKASLKTIIKSGNILQELLQELLNYAAHLAGVEESSRTFSIEEIAADMRATFSNRAETTGVRLEINVHESPAEEPGDDRHTVSSIEVESDYEKIKHICTSLISNALKFTHPERKPASGSNVAVHLSIRRTNRALLRSMGSHAQSAMFEIMVQDNGIGISRDKMTHVFDVFVQGEDALSKRFTGTGLGLALSKLLCERLGGYISIYSRLGIGTTVICRIPVRNVNGSDVLPSAATLLLESPVFALKSGRRAVWRTDTFHCGQVNCETLSRRSSSASKQKIEYEPAPSPSAIVSAKDSRTDTLGSSTQPASTDRLPHPSPIEEPVKLNSAEARKLRVLVADDNQVMRELVRRILVLLGIGHIDLATNGHSAIEKVENAIVEGVRYSIIFMDLTMPDTDGIEATSNIQKQLGYFCPVVALTGHSDEKTIERCKAAGIQKVLVKPVTRDQLAQAISESVGIPIVTRSGASP